MDQVLIECLDYYITIAGTVLLISFLLPGKKSKLFIISVFYSIFVISLQFGLKEVVYPRLKPTPQIAPAELESPYTVVLKEFETIDTLPQKNGIILKNSNLCFVFGTVAQQNPSSYLVKNAFFKDQGGNFLISEYAKVIDNKIILYKSTAFKNQTTTNLPKNYLLALPFDMESFFNLWNTTDPRYIEVLPILVNHSFSQSFILPIALALSQYLLSFILLIIIGIVATSFYGQLSFKNAHVFGSLATIICSYPFVLLIHYYLSLIVHTIVHYIIKI